MPQLSFTPIAKEWLTRRIEKEHRKYQSLPENSAKKQIAFIKHWDLMNRKFKAEQREVNADGTLPMALKRVELKSLQVLIMESIVQLNTKVIPEYQARVDRVPERAERYREYLAKTEELVRQLGKLLNDINQSIMGA
jgi:hypothetical protein